jgi:predicted nucleotide-binding protein
VHNQPPSPPLADEKVIITKGEENSTARARVREMMRKKLIKFKPLVGVRSRRQQSLSGAAVNLAKLKFAIKECVS